MYQVNIKLLNLVLASIMLSHFSLQWNRKKFLKKGWMFVDSELFSKQYIFKEFNHYAFYP